METENNFIVKRLVFYSVFVSFVLIMSSCDILMFSESERHPIIINSTSIEIPNDSMVTLPIVKTNDSILLKSFDEVIFLNSVYLTHAKQGERTWYEANFSIVLDTINISIYAHQYEVADRVKPGQYKGVVPYNDNLFLIKIDSTSYREILEQTNDSITFNSIYKGVQVFFMIDENYNYPEYIKAKYTYHNKTLIKKRIEINNYLFEDGRFNPNSGN